MEVIIWDVRTPFQHPSISMIARISPRATELYLRAVSSAIYSIVICLHNELSSIIDLEWWRNTGMVCIGFLHTGVTRTSIPGILEIPGNHRRLDLLLQQSALTSISDLAAVQRITRLPNFRSSTHENQPCSNIEEV